MGTQLIRVRPEELDELGAVRIRVRPEELDQPELLAPPSLEGFPEVKLKGRIPVTIGGPRYGPPGEVEKVRKEFERPLLPVGRLYEQQIAARVGDDPNRWALNTLVDTGQVFTNIVEGLSTPANVAILGSLAVAPQLGVPALVSRLVMFGFSAEMAKGAADEIVIGYEEAKRGNLRRAGQHWGGSVAQAALSILAARGGAHPDIRTKGIRAAWEDFYKREGMAGKDATKAANLSTQKGAIPPAHISTEAVKAAEAGQRAQLAPPPIELAQPAVQRAERELPKPPVAETLRLEANRLQARLQEATGAERVLAEQRIAENRQMLAEIEGAFRPEAPKLPEPTERIGRELKAGERGSLRVMGELPPEIEVMPRAADLAPILEFLVSPSKAFGKVHPAAGEIARRTIETTENIARDTAKAIGEYETVWRPLKAGEAQRVIRLLDNPDVTPGSVPPNTPTRVRESYVRTRALLDTQRERINQAREAAGIPPITGVTEGYWPHVFQGSWGVTKLVGEKWTPIETGWLVDSQVSGIAKAREYLSQNPGTSLRVELKKLHFQPEEATILPRGSYFRLMNRLSKMTAAEIDPSGEIRVGPMGRGPAFEKLWGVARPGARKPGKAFFGHVQPRRTDLAGWLEDPKALEILIRGAERYIGMTPLRAGAAKLREQVQREAPEATRLHSQLDSYIDAAILGRPDKFTQSFNAAWEHVGERMGLTAKPAALQRISRTVNQVQSMTKLGFSPVSAFVNLSQTALNTYPVLGAKWTARGIRDYATGKNKWLIDELGIRQQISKAEEANFRDYMAAQWPRTAREVPHFAWRGTVDMSLMLFRKAEEANRSVASLGAYAHAKARGLSDVAAVTEARDVLTRTQFVYGPADAPAVLRAAWMRVPGQFKTFMLKEMEFILNLKGREVPRFMAALTLATGVVGVPGAMLLDEMVEITSGWTGEPYSPLEDLRIKARQLKGVKGVAARTLTMGLPSALGVDLVRNIGFQEYFSPGMLSLRSLLGPTGNDITNLVSVATANPGRDRQEAFRTLKAGLSPSARRLSTILTQKGKLINPRTKQVILADIKPWEAVALAMGFTPNRVAQARDVEWAITKEVLEDRSLKGGYVDQVAEGMILENEAYEAGNLEEAKRHAAEWEALANKAAEVGFPDIRRAARLRAIKLARPSLRERLRRAPRRMRRRLEEELLPPNEVMLKAKEGEITPAEANRRIPRRQRAIKLLRPPPQE